MRYNPDAASGLLPAGQYPATVKIANDKTSKAGNEMIEVILTVYGKDGLQVDVFDYLLSLDNFQWKVRHFCESAGLDYARGELVADQCVDRNLRVNLGLKKQEGYADKNDVLDYLPHSHPGDAGEPPPHDDSDVPF